MPARDSSLGEREKGKSKVFPPQIRKVHFVGIAGVGMSALAIYCKKRGMAVTGSDDGREYITWKALKRSGISWQNSFDPSHVPPDADLVVVTVAHGGLTENPEAIAAKKRGLQVVSLAQAIGRFANSYKVIAVAGTHGKTTTAAMIATILVRAGLDPSWVPIGTATIPTLPSHGHAGRGEWFITEADEYLDRPRGEGGRPRFLYLEPTIAVITSVDWDHPDVYPTEKHYVNAFKKFMKQVRPGGLIVALGDSPTIRRLAKGVKARIVWYGAKRLWPHMRLQVVGLHNKLNATAAARVAHELGIDQKTIVESLAAFRGTERRLENKGEWKGVELIDDYAHHPTEIKASLSALRETYPKRRLVVVFQPHTFSRTKAFLDDFARSFTDADQVMVMDIFGSARETSGTVTSSDLVKKAQQHHQHISHVPYDLKTVANQLRRIVKKGDVLVTMGATEVYRLHDLLKKG